jgi:hypothetical protein
MGEGRPSIPNEIFNLVKCIVGAGVLSLSAGVAAFGSAPSALIPAAFLIAIMGATSAYTFILMARVSAMTGATSYADAWNKTREKVSAWIIAASSALDCFAGNLTYSMELADTYKALLSFIGVGVTQAHALLGLTTSSVLLPLCLVQDLSALAPFFLVSISGMLYTAVVIGIFYFRGAYASPAGPLLTNLPSHLHPTFGSVGAGSSQSQILDSGLHAENRVYCSRQCHQILQGAQEQHNGVIQWCSDLFVWSGGHCFVCGSCLHGVLNLWLIHSCHDPQQLFHQQRTDKFELIRGCCFPCLFVSSSFRRDA